MNYEGSPIKVTLATLKMSVQPTVSECWILCVGLGYVKDVQSILLDWYFVLVLTTASCVSGVETPVYFSCFSEWKNRLTWFDMVVWGLSVKCVLLQCVISSFQVSLGGFEITPPVVLRLKCGSGPVHIS